MRGERVRQLREAVPWTQEDLAERARRYSDDRPVPVQTVLRIEKNQNQPSAWLLSALAQALDTTADYLLGLTDDPSIPALPRYPIPAPELYAAVEKANALDVGQRVTLARIMEAVCELAGPATQTAVQQLAALPQARPFLRQSESELRAYVEGLRDQLAHGDYQAQRWVLHQVIARVVVGSELVIEYRTPT